MNHWLNSSKKRGKTVFPEVQVENVQIEADQIEATWTMKIQILKYEATRTYYDTSNPIITNTNITKAPTT